VAQAILWGGTVTLSDPAIGPDEFAALMAPLGPFEAPPRVAVAVSGGADSLALCLLAAAWAQSLGGSAIGLTVDHGLRPEAAAEAARVGSWLAARGIAHRTLVWQGEKPGSGIQAAARAARYRLLAEWCAGAGVLHLLLAHHREDQAETFLLRLQRGSGVDGLSAMPAAWSLPEVRLLRPLLPMPCARLRATLTAVGQDWIEDPSNRDPRYRRVRYRALQPVLAAEGLDARRLAATAAGLARARRALEEDTATLLAASVEMDPAGFAWLEPTALAAAPMEVALRALAALCRTISGGTYPPRLARLERLLADFDGNGPARTRSFAGCLLVPLRQRILVCREGRSVAPGLPVTGPGARHWDGRYRVTLAGEGIGEIRALGRQGWLSLRRQLPLVSIPPIVAATLPALVDPHGISAVPHLGYAKGDTGGLRVVEVGFAPANPLTPV
jgi:tRNA(Ile)-lysidine synthase